MRIRKRLWYPKINDIVNNNKKVIEIHKETKAERHQIRGTYNLPKVIKEAKRTKCDVDCKAAILLRGINQAHAFGSANKRTAYFTANQFICKNKGYLLAKKREKQKEIAIKVREGRITDKEIAHWLKYADKDRCYGVDR